ncbi:MAG: hypothetical protein K0M78_01495 [Brevundimonas sp.]|nr:hypothetical protein [Brevundimonas sp.]
MDEQVFKILISDVGDERVLIVRRGDGAYTYRREWHGDGGWADNAIDLGIYDSADTAEAEARVRVSWLIPAFH